MRQKRQALSPSSLPKPRQARAAKIVPVLSDELSQTIEQAKQLLYSQDMGAVAASVLSQPLAHLTERTMPQPGWIVPELLPVGVTVLAGLPGAGKSILALGLALAIAEDALFLNRFPVKPGDVLYLGLEDSQRTFHRRVQQFMQGGTPHVDNQQSEAAEQLPVQTVSSPDEAIAASSAQVVSKEQHTLVTACEWAGKWHTLHTCGLADLEDWLDLHPQARLIVIDSLLAVRPLLAKRRLSLRNDPILFPLRTMAQAHQIAFVLIYHLHTYDLQNVSELMNNASQTMIDSVMLLRREASPAIARLTMNGKDICEQELLLAFEPQQGYRLIEKSESIYGKK